MKAHMSFITGVFTDAVSHYTQAIESSPGKLLLINTSFKLLFIVIIEPIFELYFNRGVVYTSVRKHEEALEDFAKALEISPDSTSALRWRGEILAKLSRYILLMNPPFCSF